MTNQMILRKAYYYGVRSAKIVDYTHNFLRVKLPDDTEGHIYFSSTLKDHLACHLRHNEIQDLRGVPMRLVKKESGIIQWEVVHDDDVPEFLRKT